MSKRQAGGKQTELMRGGIVSGEARQAAAS